MTQHVTARRRIVRAAAAGLALAGLLAGCASHPGAAAVVDGRQISASDVATALDELRPAAATLTPQLVLQTLIEEPTVVQLASDEGIGVSDDDAKATLDSYFQASDLEAPGDYSPATLVVGRREAAIAKLSAQQDVDRIGQEYLDRLGALHVSVNPRFGSFDAGKVTDPIQPVWMVGATTPTP